MSEKKYFWSIDELILLWPHVISRFKLFISKSSEIAGGVDVINERIFHRHKPKLSFLVSTRPVCAKLEFRKIQSIGLPMDFWN